MYVILDVSYLYTYPNGSMVKRLNLPMQFFSSFEEEAKAEYHRRAQQSQQERMTEFSILQERCFGEKWTQGKIEPVVSFEEVSW